MNMLSVMPAEAGIQISLILLMSIFWTPASAGVTMTFHTAPDQVRGDSMPESSGSFVDTGYRIKPVPDSDPVSGTGPAGVT
ncbi:MAG: hypothetical protein BMS9Abin22_097 [Gammaproteobacteria bacterium]|nr:MAG: hypothetical protein BMS9Abin22_097 [Gammaproteobacteria bacterium]